MGGYGSGGWQSGRATVEGCRQLDINRFARDRFIQHDPFVWTWWNDEGEEKASIVVYPEQGGLRLKYTSTICGEKQDMNYLVPIVYARVGYGSRPYFLCPICSKRCLKLYINSRYFSCRKCTNLTYKSTLESEPDRAMRRSRKIRRKLGASESMAERIYAWDKPKRMRWYTFYRLKNQAEHFEAKGWNLIYQELKLRHGFIF